MTFEYSPSAIAARLQFREVEAFFTEEQWRTIAARLELSRRELEIVRLIFEDAEESSISGDLGISVNTVRTLLKRLYGKLGVRRRVGLVLRIVSEHLAELQDSERPEPILRLVYRDHKAA
jgi:DNA-binding CsgD family transcriptional regulator